MKYCVYCKAASGTAPIQTEILLQLLAESKKQTKILELEWNLI